MFKVGEAVRWTSSQVRKEGVIMFVIPANVHPKYLGYHQLGKGSSTRDHETYVVRGGTPGDKKTALYWPMVSLLRAKEGLTADEVAWCQANANIVRNFIAENRTDDAAGKAHSS